MFRLTLMVCSLLAACISANAQFVIKGRVMENKTRIPLAGVRIENLNTKQSTLTDNNGNFNITADLNHLLVFKVFSYEPDTVLVTGHASLEVFLALQTHSLKGVNVTTTTGPGSLRVYDPDFHGQTMAYQTDSRGNKIGGVTFRLWYWKKDEHRKQKNKQREREWQIEEQIEKEFSTATVAKYIPLKGIELERFVEIYIPSVALWQSNDFNMLSYIDACYKKFRLLPERERMTKDSLTLK